MEGGVQEVEMRRDPLLIVGRAELDVVEGGAGRQQLDPAGRLLGMVRIEAHGGSMMEQSGATPSMAELLYMY